MSELPDLRILASTSAAPRIVREISRRRVLSAAALGGGAALLAARGGSSKGGAAGSAGPKVDDKSKATGGPVEDALSIYSWGDYDDPELLKEFTAKEGPKITVDAFGSNEELIAKLVAAKGTSGYDIVVPTGVFIPQMVKNGLLMRLNKDLIPNLSHMDPAYMGRSWDPQNDHSICKAWGTTGFVYDKTAIKRELKTWSDFLDCAQKEASGKVSLLDDPGEITGMYYWANGIDWNTTEKAHIDAAEDFIVNKLAKHVAAFDSYPGTGSMPAGKNTLIQIWNGDCRQGILESKNPDKWQWVLGAPTTELWMDNWAVSASAKHPEAAHKFINFVLEPDNALKELDYTGYPTGAKDIEEKAKAAEFELLDMVFFTPEQVATMKDAELNSAQARTVEIWNKAKAAAGA
jgi:spermidine/putrescine transport system substrate-binding protein